MSLVLTGCAGTPASVTPGSPVEVGGREKATAGGLGAGLIAHLESREVTQVSGLEADGPTVSVDVSDPSLRSVLVSIDPADSRFAVRECGVDAGYERVSCTSASHLAEIVRRTNDDPELPALIGRYHGNRRGSVLVQVWGADSPANRRLVGDVLADPLLGIETSAALNATGRHVTVDELRVDTRRR